MEFTPQIVLMTGLLVLITIQFIKGTLVSLKKNKLDLFAYLEQAGMPSTHTATVTSLVLGVYFAQGFSMLFAMMIMAWIYIVEEVITIQRSVSKHSKIINGVLEFLKLSNHKPTRHKKLFEKPMREKWGHKPLEILVGFLLGIIITLIIYII